MAKVPFELDGIEPIKLIGTGGFGEVWLANQTKIDRRVAIKVGHAPIDDETIQVRFERECVALGRLSGHPNIVDVFTAGQLSDDRPYLMLEYISGGTLWQRLNRDELTEEELRRIGLELADALSIAHTAGVLHRDLKPENVLLRQNGEAVLGDFGIARLHDSANTTSHSITASVAYASPEILAGKPASMASDLYGIGICLLTAGIRGVPFVKHADESVHPIINRVLSDRPPNLGNHGFSQGLAAVVDTLLEKDPNDRPLSAEVVQQLLVQLAATDAAAGPSPSQPTQNPTISVPALTTLTPAATSQPVNPETSNPATRSGSFRSSDSLAVDLVAAAEQATPAGRGRRWRGSKRRRSRSDRVRLFGAAFGATLLLGGLLVFGASRYTDYSLPTISAGTTPVGEPANNVIVPTTTRSSTTSPPAPEPLSLPLELDDTDLASGAGIQPDVAGPNSSQFCDITPTTIGLIEWTGETMGDPLGFPLVFQQLARFESAEQASAYLNTYLPAPSCAEWTIPPEDGSPAIVLAPQVVQPATEYGDETGEIVFDGASGEIELYGRVAVVRSRAEIYTLSINSLFESDLDQLDELLKLAMTRLGY